MVMPPLALLLAGGYYYCATTTTTTTTTTNPIVTVALRSAFAFACRRRSLSTSSSMERRGSSRAIVGGPTPSSSSSEVVVDETTKSSTKRRRPRVLCLHGRYQSGSIFSNKIGGARRKLERTYDLHFLDGPILLIPPPAENDDDDPAGDPTAPRAWWDRDDDGRHVHVREAFEYVVGRVDKESKEEEGEDGDHDYDYDEGKGRYDAVLGFSQGGTLATALALSGVLGPRLRAVITAGAPFVEEALDIASEMRSSSSSSSSYYSSYSTSSYAVGGGGYDVPKLHLAGTTDALVSVESTAELCRRGGNGRMLVHDRGHLFPTNSALVMEVLDFLDGSLSSSSYRRSMK